MIGVVVRRLFKKGKLYVRESFFGTTTICYERKGIVRLERTFATETRKEKYKMHDFIFELYFEFEYEEGDTLSSRQIAQLLGVDHKTIDNCLKRIRVLYIDKLK